MIGNFDAILGSHECMRSSYSTISIKKFSDMVSFCNLVKIDTGWAYYTYFKGDISSIRSPLNYGLCS